MHITIRRYRIHVGSTQELVDRINTGFLPIISKAANFVAYYAINEGDGDISSISIFKDKAGADASNELATAWVMQNLASLISMPPKIIAGEVVAASPADGM